MVVTVMPKSSRPEQFLFHHCIAKAGRVQLSMDLQMVKTLKRAQSI